LANLTRKGGRALLPVKREPHWHKIDEGAYLGFRRGPDTWIARFRERSGKQNYHALEVPRDSKDEFLAAKSLAEAWFTQMGNAAAVYLRSRRVAPKSGVAPRMDTTNQS
jgi:hypothetical protein